MSDPALDAQKKEQKGDSAHYTAFIRLPFPRGDFQDPPLVDWGDAKDKALWKILSGNPRSSELNWKELAVQFDVTLPFILQQAAWLYERQLSSVREQMRRVSKPDAAPDVVEAEAASPSSPRPSSGRRASVQPVRSPSDLDIKSTGLQTVSPSVQPVQASQEAQPPPQPTDALNLPTRAAAPPLSRTASSNTVTQSSQRPSSRGGLRSKASFQRSTPPDRPSPSKLTSRRPSHQAMQRPPRPSSPSTSDDSTSSDSDAIEAQPKRSQYLRRSPRFTSARAAASKPGASRAAIASDDDDEDERPFLPFSEPTEGEPQDLGATVRGKGKAPDSQTDDSSDAGPSKGITKIDSSISSAASSAAPMQPRETPTSQRSPVSHTFSPRHRAELAVMNSGRRGKGREGSEGTPSMGSSFSDLDDTSVTQSALEEALQSNLQKGVGTSRISNLSQALRSQYSRYQGSGNQRQPGS